MPREMPTATRLLRTDVGDVEWADFGRGDPVTLFVHGLGGSIATTRPFASGVRGRRAFFHFRGHGRSTAPPGPWTYDALAAEVGAVADHVGARQVLGVSMGAGALCALLAREPARFDRVVLALPAALSRPRDAAEIRRSEGIADLIDAADTSALAEALAAEQVATPEAGDQVRHWAAQQAAWLAGSGAAKAFRDIPRAVPVPDPALLARVRTPVLVVAQRADQTHPVSVAEEVAAALPCSHLVVFQAGGLLWSHRVTLRRFVTGFLNDGKFPTLEGEST